MIKKHIKFGLFEVKPVGADYIPATPIPGTVLVNLGDLMQRWTADKLVATVKKNPTLTDCCMNYK